VHNRCTCSIDGGVQSFLLSPDGSRIFVTTPDAVDIYDPANSKKVCLQFLVWFGLVWNQNRSVVVTPGAVDIYNPADSKIADLKKARPGF